MSLALLFLYLMLNMFRMLIHPSSGACDLFVELFHGLYCSGSMCVGVTLWFGWGSVVSVCRLRHQHTSNQSNTTHEITRQISRKLLRVDVLTSETCWALNNEIIKQVTSSWSLFIQLCVWKYEEWFWRGNSEVLRERTCSSAPLSTINPLWITLDRKQTSRMRLISCITTLQGVS